MSSLSTTWLRFNIIAIRKAPLPCGKIVCCINSVKECYKGPLQHKKFNSRHTTKQTIFNLLNNIVPSTAASADNLIGLLAPKCLNLIDMLSFLISKILHGSVLRWGITLTVLQTRFIDLKLYFLCFSNAELRRKSPKALTFTESF